MNSEWKEEKEKEDDLLWDGKSSLHISDIKRTNDLNITVFSAVTNKVCMRNFCNEKHDVVRIGGTPLFLQWCLK